jgi:hypothetical protein
MKPISQLMQVLNWNPSRFNDCGFDGAQVAHVLTACTIWEKEFHYHDPWPGRSLLCGEMNRAGVDARESDLAPWRISRQEFEKAVFAVLLYDANRMLHLILQKTIAFLLGAYGHLKLDPCSYRKTSNRTPMRISRQLFFLLSWPSVVFSNSFTTS